MFFSTTSLDISLIAPFFLYKSSNANFLFSSSNISLVVSFGFVEDVNLIIDSFIFVISSFNPSLVYFEKL